VIRSKLTFTIGTQGRLIELIYQDQGEIEEF